jgi:hypothetical protein
MRTENVSSTAQPLTTFPITPGTQNDVRTQHLSVRDDEKTEKRIAPKFASNFCFVAQDAANAIRNGIQRKYGN